MLLLDESSHIKMGPVALVLVIVDALTLAHDASDRMDPINFVLTLLAAILIAHSSTSNFLNLLVRAQVNL